MTIQRRVFAYLVLAGAAAACSQAVDSPVPDAPAFAAPATSLAAKQLAQSGSCATAPDRVVSTQAELRDAIASATPGEVIAVNGSIGLAPNDDSVLTSNITITCAAPGAKVYWAGAPNPAASLFEVYAPGVRIHGLELDATGIALAVWTDNSFGNADDIRIDHDQFTCHNICIAAAFVRHTIVDHDQGTCGGICVYFTPVRDGVVLDNSFETFILGIQIQSYPERVDSTVVEGNTVTLEPPPTPYLMSGCCGGIRVTGGSYVRIADNVVEGRWEYGIALRDLESATVIGNRVSGTEYGLALSTDAGPLFPVEVVGSLFRANRITDTGSAGILVRLACSNAFVGNALLRDSAGIGAYFDVSTGANAFAGNGTTVVDHGATDCNGDGIIDPNRITGTASVRHGGPFLALQQAVPIRGFGKFPVR